MSSPCQRTSTSTTDSSSSSSSTTTMKCPILPNEPVTEETRANIWAMCLNVSQKNKNFERLDFEKMDTIPNLSSIVHYATMIAEQIAITEFDRQSYKWEIMRILSYHCAITNKYFDPIYGWQDLLEPLMTLRVSEVMKYKLFKAILNYYIPQNEDCVSILRLLLIYHDPKLYNFLSSKQILLTDYPFPWINRLLTAFCPIPLILAIWDRYFIEKKRFLIFFLSLALMINFRNKILKLKNDDKKTVVHTLWALPLDITIEDISELFTLAHDLRMKTPLSFLEKLCPIIFNDEEDECSIFNTVCWPMTVEELTKTMEKSPLLSAVSRNIKYFIIDCRSQEEFDAGHLLTAYSLDYNLRITNPIKFTDNIEKLVDLQKHLININCSVRHFCFIDSGRDDDRKYTRMIVRSCFQRNIKYVSILLGGYIALHKHFEEKVDDFFENHNIKRCLVCKKNEKPSEMKQRLIRLRSQGQEFISRLKSSKSVYAVDDETAGPSRMVKSKSMFETPFETVSIMKWLKDPRLVQYFKCKELDSSNKHHDGYLLITKDYLIALREIPDREDAAQISVKRLLSRIIKINAKRKNTSIIVFKYSKETKSDDLVVNDKNEFLFPDSSEAMQFFSGKYFKTLLML